MSGRKRERERERERERKSDRKREREREKERERPRERKRKRERKRERTSESDSEKVRNSLMRKAPSVRVPVLSIARICDRGSFDSKYLIQNVKCRDFIMISRQIQLD